MSGHRDLVKKILPDRFVDWWRRRRRRVLEAAGGATKVTPGMVVRHGYAKTEPARAVVRKGVVKITPKPIVTRRRRKRALDRYLKALSYELLERETQLDYIEGRVAARRDGFYERIVREVLERTEIIQQELDRRIEGVSARSGERMNAIEEQLFALRDGLNNLRRLQDLELNDVGARARAEVPEVPSADRQEADSPAEARTADADATVTEAEAHPAAEDDDTSKASGNGHHPAQAPAASAAE